MTFIADLHLHSRYSRATAKNLDFEHLYQAARLKGVTVVGTGDFTHPAWLNEMETKLEQTEPGLFSLKKDLADEIDKTIPGSCKGEVRFILQCEISNIYKKNDRVRKNHNLVYFPDLDSVKKMNAALDAIGNITSDGRPILGLDAKKLLEIMLDINDQGIFIPAHIWTPWFSLFGSKSGFDSMAECFEELTDHIFAVETGLSSDPPMNWRIKELDHVRLVSSSDAHSPGVLGRNASVFNTDLSFTHIRDALKNNDPNAYQGTLDMYPHQGKYHYDGHRKCNICLNPATTVRLDGICPECGKPLTCGVLYRVQELASRPEGFVPENRHGYKRIIPLTDILSEIFEVGPKTKKVATYYNRAIEVLGPELPILTDLSYDAIEQARVPLLADAVMRMRNGDIRIDPGYDGEYGVVNIFEEAEKNRLRGEKDLLFELPKKKSTKKKSARQQIPVKAALSKRKSNGTLRTPVSNDLLSGLNPQQKRAVESDARSMVVQAGPGTGKTRTLTAKIAWLMSRKKVAPQQILALTFTNKAATELAGRIAAYIPRTGHGEGVPKPSVMSATFHSFCLHLLKTADPGFNAAILDDEARLELIRQALVSSGDKTVKQGEIRAADLFISRCKQQLLAPGDPLPDELKQGNDPALEAAYQRYAALCEEEKGIDFEDLILKAVTLLQGSRTVRKTIRSTWPYLFIDEYQDLNFGQYVLSRLLAKGNQITVIGDPDQSIYGFRGSDNRFFDQFEADFPGCEKICLTQNYRSTQTILDASFQMISKQGDNAQESRIYSGIGGAAHLVIRPAVTEKAEAVTVGKMIEKLVGGTSFFSMDAGRIGETGDKEYSFADFAVLYRTRRQCDTFATIFEKEGIPFQTADRKKVFEINGVRQLVSLCRIAAGCHTVRDIRVGFDHFGCSLNHRALKPVREICRDNRSGLFTARGAGVFGPETGLSKMMQKRAARAVQKIGACIDTTASMTSAAMVEHVCKAAGLSRIIDTDDAAAQALETILARARLTDDPITFLNTLILDRDSDCLGHGAEKVSLMTLHAAKGLEFPVVFVTGCEHGLIPYARDGRTVDDPNEERRLFYVGMTRAMDILCLTYAQKRRIYGTQMKRQRSLFIDDIEKKLMKLEQGPARTPAPKKEQQLELF